MRLIPWRARGGLPAAHLVAATLIATLLAVPASAAAAPQTTIHGGPSGPHASRTATFTFSSSLAGSTFLCRLDSGYWKACTSPRTYTRLKQGPHTFRVKAKKGSRVDKTAAIRTFTVDTIAPGTTITDGPPAATLDIRPELSFASNEAGVSFECALNGSTFEPCTPPYHANGLGLRDPHTFSVRARDAAGNIDATPATRAFTIESFSSGGAPYGDPIAELYFPSSVDLDVPADCEGYKVDCPDGTPLAPADQMRLSGVSFGVTHVPTSSRFDIWAAVDVDPLQVIKVDIPLAGECDLTLNSQGGLKSFWMVTMQIDFSTYPLDGDPRFTVDGYSLSDLEPADWTLGGTWVCANYPYDTTQIVTDIVGATLLAHWTAVGIPLCEEPPPAMVGRCP